MPTRETIFYSWQSDTPSKFNRTFVEDALKEALKRLRSDATLEPALRDRNVELDKDTQGIAGSPPIAQTILKKIEDCSVFVADMTFVGHSLADIAKSSSDVRQIPNPNVLLEYGYALHCHGHQRLIAVTNTAFGNYHPDNLPFDLRHLRWPITYNLDENSKGTKAAVFDSLVATLAKALGLALVNAVSTQSREAFLEQPSTNDPSIFFSNTEDLLPEIPPFSRTPAPFAVPNEGKMFLRLFPLVSVPAFRTEFEALEAARRGPIWPMGNVRGCDHARNVFGAISYEQIFEDQLFQATQVFLSREVWGFDAFTLNRTEFAKFYAAPPAAVAKPFIPSGAVEDIYNDCLNKYLDFARTILILPLPLRVVAGLVGIKDYRIALSNKRLIGRCLTDNILWQADIISFEADARTILEPFFELIWSKCGIARGKR